MLDAINKAHIWYFVLNYAEKHNMTLLAITHNQYLAGQVATRVLRIPEMNHIQVDRSEL
jgi:peptide/nickel transport system ATP-binding protein